MSVHYKFKSALDFDTISFDSLHISVADLKKAIVHQKRLGKTHDFDLQITNAQTKEEYAEDTCLIPKNTSLIIARIPLTTQNKRQWEPPNQQQQIERTTHQPGIENANLDLSRMNGSEEDKIAAMMKQSTMEYDPENYQKVRNSSQQGEVPPNYRCHRCNKSGHWIKNCPLNALGKDPHYSHHNKFKGDGQKKMTGIPRSFINQQQQQQVQEQPQPPPVGDQKQKIPEELICSICEDLFTDAVMTPCCGMSFCDECVRTALLESEDNQCPDCKEKGTSPGSLIPNRFLRNNVNSFRNETGYSKVSQPKLVPVEEPEETAEQVVENPDTTEENLEQSGETTENIVESSENYPTEGEENAECQETVVDEGEGLEDPNFDVENENDFDDETEHVLADGQEPIEEEFRDYDERDQTSDDEDNITVTVPPAHMQVRVANFRGGRHRMRDQHVENYNQNQNPDTNSNTPTFEEKEGHSEENVDYKYRHQKKPHHSNQSQIPSVSGPYRNNEEMGGNTNQQQNYPPNSNPQGIPSNEMQSQQEMYHQNPNPNVYHQQQGPVHHSQQPQQMHGPVGHYPPQQPYGQPYGAPMGMRPMRYDPHGYNRHPGPPHHMVRGGYHGHDQYMARQRHLAPSLSAAAREVQQTFGTGIIEDPLEAFNKIMREKEMQKKREKERRRSPDRDRRSHSFDRKRSPAYSPDNHRKSPPDRGRSEDRDRERERNRRHRSSSYNSESSRSFSRSRSRSRKRNTARRRSRSRSHSPQRYPRRRDNYPKDHYRDDRHRSPDRYSRNRGGYRGRGGRGYYNRNYENRSGDNYNQQNYPHHMKQNDYQGYAGQQAPPMAQQSYMEGYVPYESDPRQMAIKPTNVVDPTAMIQSHPYEVQVHTMEEQPPPPGYETSPKDDDSVNKPLITSNQMDESNPKNDSFDSTANLPDTTDRKYLSEDENVVKNNKGRRSNSMEKIKEKERTKDSSKIDHKKSHSRHHHSEKRRDRERDRDRDKEKERDSSTDDGKRDKKSKDKKKRKKSKETEKKKNKKERKEKDKDKDKDKKDKEHHHHHKDKRVGEPENEKDLKKAETVESAGDDKGLSTTVSNTNENSMEAIDSEQVPSSTTTKDIQEHFDDATTNTPEHMPQTPTKDATENEISAVESSDQKEPQSPIHFNRSDSVLDIYTNLDFEGELEDEVEQQSPQKSELPELSKWERDEDNQVTSIEKINQQVDDANVSGNEKSSDEKVTSEVLKRAENAIFARAINAIKPLETKKSSTDRERQKQYSSSSNSESNKETLPGIVSHKKSESAIMDFKTETVQITVPANEENPSRSVEIKTDVSQKKNSPIRSVKDRLGSKIVEKKRSRSRTRSRTPKRKLMSTTGRSTIGQRKRSISRSRSRERGRGRDDRRNDRGKPYDRSRDIGRGIGGDSKRGQDIMRSTIRHSSKERLQYERRQRSRNRSRDRRSRSRDKRTTNRRSRSPQGPPPSSTNEESRAKKRNTDETKTEDATKKTSSVSLDASAKTNKKSKEDSATVKKRHRSPSSTSSRSDSDSSSSSDSDDSKHHKKHGKKTKKKNRASSTESQASASKRKKLKKNKKSVKKKKKSKK